tara:strand:+ start:922 stop:1248 length:327 start_codon:yes stop_codon:yes gene_type:complete
MTDYLKTKIAESKQTETPRYGEVRIVDGKGRLRVGRFSTSYLIRLEGEKRFRRVMCWQFSNVGTLFVRIKGTPYIVREYDIPTPAPDTVAIESDTWAGVLAQADKLRT